jgi:hypothetical protein
MVAPSPSASAIGGESGGPKDDQSPEGKYSNLLRRDRSQNPLSRGDSSKANQKRDYASTTIEGKNQDATSKDKTVESQNNEELVFEQLLGDANSKVLSTDSEGGDKSKTNLQSSRFALMMAGLKSTGKCESSMMEDAGTDDDHIFVAPRIVDVNGHSFRHLLVQSLSDSESNLFSNYPPGEEKQDISRGRFQVPQSSVTQCTENTITRDISNLKQVDNRKEDLSMVVNHHDPNDDDIVSVDDSTHSSGSISAESLGEYQSEDPSMRQDVDEVHTSDDYPKSFVESKLSILPSINESGEYNTANDDEYETDSFAREDESISESIDALSPNTTHSGLNNGAISMSPQKTARPDSLFSSPDAKMNESISAYDLMRMFDDYCNPNHHHNIALQIGGGTNVDADPPLSMSLDLSVLDSKWLLKSSSGIVERRSASTVHSNKHRG